MVPVRCESYEIQKSDFVEAIRRLCTIICNAGDERRKSTHSFFGARHVYLYVFRISKILLSNLICLVSSPASGLIGEIIN